MSQNQLKKYSAASRDKILDSKINNFSNEPFKHIYIDDFFGEKFAAELLENFPSLDSDLWERTNDPEIEVKMRSKWSSEFDIPEKIIDVIRIMNSAPFLESLSNALDIQI